MDALIYSREWRVYMVTVRRAAFIMSLRCLLGKTLVTRLMHSLEHEVSSVALRCFFLPVRRYRTLTYAIQPEQYNIDIIDEHRTGLHKRSYSDLAHVQTLPNFPCPLHLVWRSEGTVTPRYVSDVNPVCTFR